MMADAEQVTKASEGASNQATQGLAGDSETPAPEGEAAVEEMGKTA
jgi:hypothetical protein